MRAHSDSAVTSVLRARPALEDVQEIRTYIARDSPRYARAVAERIFAAVDWLYEHPLSGRVVPELGRPTVREVIEPPYRIVYRGSRVARPPIATHTGRVTAGQSHA